MIPPWMEGARLVVFDADDTLRRTKVPGQPCPHGDGEWELIPGVRETLARIPWGDCGVRVAIASNQDHVGYGHLSRDDAERMLREMVVHATDGAVRDPLIRMCTHVLEARCECRKPAPGMLLDLLATSAVAPHECVFIGDAEKDRQAAAAAGVRFEWATVLHST